MLYIEQCRNVFALRKLTRTQYLNVITDHVLSKDEQFNLELEINTMEFSLNGAELSVNSGNSENLRNH